VTQLEVTPQNVKQPKNGRNSGHVRNSGDYGTWPIYLAGDSNKLKTKKHKTQKVSAFSLFYFLV
jgi:hypothetical protein